MVNIVGMSHSQYVKLPYGIKMTGKFMSDEERNYWSAHGPLMVQNHGSNQPMEPYTLND